jgi:hypothetical protein
MRGALEADAGSTGEAATVAGGLAVASVSPAVAVVAACGSVTMVITNQPAIATTATLRTITSP